MYDKHGDSQQDAAGKHFKVGEKVRTICVQTREVLLDLLFPKRCALCQKLLRKEERYICRECKEELPLVGQPKCQKCCKPLENGRDELCIDCKKTTHLYTQGSAVFVYDKKMQHSIILWKYHDHRIFGEFYGKMMNVYAKKMIRKWQPQVILPVPLHKRKLRVRGFNQAEQVAEIVGKACQIPVRSDLVYRVHATKAQKKLAPAERKKNLCQAFSVNGGYCPYKRVLLVDDIYTTGSTIDGIAGKLLEAGAEEIYFLSVCIGSQSDGSQ